MLGDMDMAGAAGSEAAAQAEDLVDAGALQRILERLARRRPRRNARCRLGG
jgi:hypothetical protein